MTNSAAKGIISTEVSSADPDAAGSGPSKGCGMAETKLRYVGFCGADDSVHPNKMALISRSYPWVEWGVLFRPDKVRCARMRRRVFVRASHCLQWTCMHTTQCNCRDRVTDRDSDTVTRGTFAPSRSNSLAGKGEE